MAYRLHIKCLKPFNNWEEDIKCSPKPSKMCYLMRYMANQYPQCTITLYDSDNSVIAYAKWSARRKCHDLGVEPAWQWLMQKEGDEPMYQYKKTKDGGGTRV